MTDDIFPAKDRTTSMIKRSEHKLRAILDASPFPIIVSTLADHRVMYLNRDAAKLFGYNQNTAHGQPEPDILYVLTYPNTSGENVGDLGGHYPDGPQDCWRQIV